MWTMTYAQMRKTLKFFAHKAMKDYAAEVEENSTYNPSDTVMRLRGAAASMDCNGADGIIDLALALKPDLVLTERDRDFVSNGPRDYIPLPVGAVIKTRKSNGLTAQFFMKVGTNKFLYLASKSKGGGHIMDLYEGHEPLLASDDEIEAAINFLYLTLESQRFLRRQIDLALEEATPEGSEDLVSFDDWYASNVEVQANEEVPTGSDC